LPKNLTSFASLLKQIMLKPGKCHTNNLQAFSRAENDPLMEYFRAINLTKKFPLQCSCKEIEILPWPIMQQ